MGITPKSHDLQNVHVSFAIHEAHRMWMDMILQCFRLETLQKLYGAHRAVLGCAEALSAEKGPGVRACAPRLWTMWVSAKPPSVENPNPTFISITPSPVLRKDRQHWWDARELPAVHTVFCCSIFTDLNFQTRMIFTLQHWVWASLVMTVSSELCISLLSGSPLSIPNDSVASVQIHLILLVH
jgi:hypothetical protein